MSQLQSDLERSIAEEPRPGQQKLSIALMGTCGDSQWREPFKQAAKDHEVFDPKTEHWTPDCIFLEHEHMMQSQIVVFAITPETEGLISLAEVGIALAGIMAERQLLVWISPTCESAKTQELKDRSTSVRESMLKHLSQIKCANFTLAADQTELFQEFTKAVGRQA